MFKNFTKFFHKVTIDYSKFNKCVPCACEYLWPYSNVSNKCKATFINLSNILTRSMSLGGIQKLRRQERGGVVKCLRK